MHLICAHLTLHCLCMMMLAALMAFKVVLKDPDGATANWVSGTDHCKWTGITCNNTTKLVTEV